MNQRNKAVLIVISVFLVIGLFAGGLYLKSIGDYKAKVAALTFDEIDLTKVEDGIYEGQCDTGVVQARVQVTVRDHQLESIELLEHENGRGTPAEAILDQMVRTQTTAVDVVSGAIPLFPIRCMWVELPHRDGYDPASLPLLLFLSLFWHILS